MNRKQKFEYLNKNKVFDFIIVGGGATGLGCALDASSRGYSVALFEKHDFCKGTSSRSTKLIHGGVRYLEKFQFKLVYEALIIRFKCNKGSVYPEGCSFPLKIKSHPALNAIELSKLSFILV